MLVQELGSGAVSQFQSVILNGTAELIPLSSVLGACLQREKLMLKVRGSESLAESYEWTKSVVARKGRARFRAARSRVEITEGDVLAEPSLDSLSLTLVGLVM